MKYLEISGIWSFILWHDDGTDDVENDGWPREKGKQEKSDSQQGGINAEVLGKTTENSEEPTVLGGFGQGFFLVHMKSPLFAVVLIIRRIN